jgi:hypothetical protein
MVASRRRSPSILGRGQTLPADPDRTRGHEAIPLSLAVSELLINAVSMLIRQAFKASLRLEVVESAAKS